MTHDGSVCMTYMVCHLPSIYPSHVSIYAIHGSYGLEFKMMIVQRHVQPPECENSSCVSSEEPHVSNSQAPKLSGGRLVTIVSNGPMKKRMYSYFGWLMYIIHFHTMQSSIYLKNHPMQGRVFLEVRSFLKDAFLDFSWLGNAYISW